MIVSTCTRSSLTVTRSTRLSRIVIGITVKARKNVFFRPDGSLTHW